MSHRSSSPSPEARYNVYKVRDGPVMADPDVPGTRYHTVIFVEMSASGTGRRHHVVGDLVTGMQYENSDSGPPEESETFYSKQFLGTVRVSAYQILDDICKKQPAPPKQKAFNPRTMRTEPVKPDGSFFQADEARPQLVKCTEWIEHQALPALYAAGIIESTEP